MSEWIDVKDQLPDKRIHVLCFQPDKVSYTDRQIWGSRILIGYLFNIEPYERSGYIDLDKIGDNAHCLLDGGNYWAFPYICHQNFVTHWMLLPEKPFEK